MAQPRKSIYAKMYLKYKKGYSLAQIGRMYHRSRQSVWEGFARRNYKLRSKEPGPFLVFMGQKFILEKSGYYIRTTGRRIRMHRIVWEYYRGQIPKGYCIHHINGDKSNNRIKNLQLIKKSEHAIFHKPRLKTGELV